MFIIWGGGFVLLGGEDDFPYDKRVIWIHLGATSQPFLDTFITHLTSFNSLTNNWSIFSFFKVFRRFHINLTFTTKWSPNGPNYVQVSVPGFQNLPREAPRQLLLQSCVGLYDLSHRHGQIVLPRAAVAHAPRAGCGPWGVPWGVPWGSGGCDHFFC